MSKIKNIYIQNIIYIICFVGFIFSENISYDDVVRLNISLDRNEYRSGEFVKLVYDISTGGDYHIYSLRFLLI